MKQSMSSAFMYNIIIIFIILVFAILAATVSYFKAFKVNNRITYALEIFEGYNHLAKELIDYQLGSIGYKVRPKKRRCKATITSGSGSAKKTGYLQEIGGEVYDYCIYLFWDDSPSNHADRERYYSYEVITYINFDFPIINHFDVPIRSRSARVFKFRDGQDPNIGVDER